jgi:hypothetical protein
MYYVDDLLRQISFVYSRDFVKFFEDQVRREVKFIRSTAKSKANKKEKERWVNHAKQALRFAFFLRYYASFESHLKERCEDLAKKESLALRLGDIKGDGFLNQVNKYLSRVAKRSPLDKHPLWNDVLAYAWVRNTIIHNDGQVPDPKSVKQFVKELMKRRSAGLTIRKSRISMNRRFCYRAVSAMGRFLYDNIQN